MSEHAPKQAWIGLVLLVLGLIGVAAHLVIAVLQRGFDWQANVFFGTLMLLGLAVWYPLGAKAALALVGESARAILTSWRSPPPPPSAPAADGE